MIAKNSTGKPGNNDQVIVPCTYYANVKVTEPELKEWSWGTLKKRCRRVDTYPFVNADQDKQEKARSPSISFAIFHEARWKRANENVEVMVGIILDLEQKTGDHPEKVSVHPPSPIRPASFRLTPNFHPATLPSAPMQLSDHSLRQIDEAYLGRLEEEALRSLSAKLLLDLKEARERLNQTSRNSSLPPSREAPWERPAKAAAEREHDPEADGPEGSAAQETPAPEKAGALPPGAGAEPSGKAEPSARKRAGKVPGAPGHGRPAPERVDAVEVHDPEECAGCRAGLGERAGQNYTGYYEADWVRAGTGWSVRITKRLYGEKPCGCGHATRAEPVRGLGEDGAGIGGFRLVGPGLASLIVALSLRYRMSRARIQEFLDDWLGVWISTGTIHAALAEVAAIVAPVEEELIQAVQRSELLHADETPWPEQGAPTASLWLWVFIGQQVALYYVSHRGQELVKNLLEGFAGVLVSDGWQSYRWLERRLRCWAHLERKAQGLADSLDPSAQGFGLEALALWDALQEAVHKAREGPPGASLRADWEGRLQAFRTRCEAMRDHPHAKAKALAAEFLNDWEAIFAVLENPFWPLTNNEAERALRHWVILRQISQGTRTPEGSRRFALLASVIDTCRLRGRSPWEYLRTAIVRRRQGMALLPLLG